MLYNTDNIVILKQTLTNIVSNILTTTDWCSEQSWSAAITTLSCLMYFICSLYNCRIIEMQQESVISLHHISTPPLLYGNTLAGATMPGQTMINDH